MRETTRALAAAGLLFVSLSAWADVTVLTLVSSWNRQQNFTALFLPYIDSVNRAGKGIVQIKFRGGPEVIPQRQLLYALRRGVIDMAFGGITYYRGVLPEGDAIFASSLTPLQAREQGAIDALQPYWNERINAHLVGWVQSGVGVNIYLTEPPRFQNNGMPDLTGFKIRTSPSNREILTQLNGRAVQIAVKEVYTALQRGTVDGLAFTTTGIPDMGIDRFIKYRIDPAFLQLAITLQINRDRWESLSEQAQYILESQADLYAQKNRTEFLAIAAQESELLRKRGLTEVAIAPEHASAYRALAHEVVWERLEQRAPESARHLKPVFYPEGLR